MFGQTGNPSFGNYLLITGRISYFDHTHLYLQDSIPQRKVVHSDNRHLVRLLQLRVLEPVHNQSLEIIHLYLIQNRRVRQQVYLEIVLLILRLELVLHLNHLLEVSYHLG